MGKHSEQPAPYETHTGAGLDESTDVFLTRLRSGALPQTVDHREGALWRFEIWRRTAEIDAEGLTEFSWEVRSAGWSAVAFADADDAAHTVLDDWFWWNHIKGAERADYTLRCGPADTEEWSGSAAGIHWAE